MLLLTAVAYPVRTAMDNFLDHTQDKFSNSFEVLVCVDLDCALSRALLQALHQALAMRLLHCVAPLCDCLLR